MPQLLKVDLALVLKGSSIPKVTALSQDPWWWCLENLELGSILFHFKGQRIFQRRQQQLHRWPTNVDVVVVVDQVSDPSNDVSIAKVRQRIRSRQDQRTPSASRPQHSNRFLRRKLIGNQTERSVVQDEPQHGHVARQGCRTLIRPSNRCRKNDRK